MKCIVLCAGYAIRLYPLTLNTPKPLLEIRGKPMLSHILDKLEELEDVDEILIATNDKFYKDFLDWSVKHNPSKKVKLINDMTKSNEDRLGGLGDLKFVLDNEKINEDLLVVAGDNLFDFSLRKFVDFFKDKGKSVVGLYDIEDISQAKNFGIVDTDQTGKILSFEEKPENPKSTLVSTAIYLYSKSDLDKIHDYMKTGNPKDALGHLFPYLLSFHDVYGFVFDGKWYDIGSKEIYDKVK